MSNTLLLPSAPPLNIASVRARLEKSGYGRVAVSTNIGEVQTVRASSCQAALGVAVAGAHLIKFGLAEQSLEAAIYLADSVIRTVRTLAYGQKKLFPAVFVDTDMCRFLDPFRDSPALARESKADGILVDTFNKATGRALLDYCSLDNVRRFVSAMHRMKKEAWIAGSISLEELPSFWATGVDIICVRGAACEAGGIKGRFGKVRADTVRRLIATIPKRNPQI